MSLHGKYPSKDGRLWVRLLVLAPISVAQWVALANTVASN